MDISAVKMEQTLRLCFILFERFMKKWNITLSQMGAIVGKYSLVTFIAENSEDINEFGVDGAIEYMLERYIVRQGGQLGVW